MAGAKYLELPGVQSSSTLPHWGIGVQRKIPVVARYAEFGRNSALGRSQCPYFDKFIISVIYPYRQRGEGNGCKAGLPIGCVGYPRTEEFFDFSLDQFPMREALTRPMRGARESFQVSTDASGRRMAMIRGRDGIGKEMTAIRRAQMLRWWIAMAIAILALSGPANAAAPATGQPGNAASAAELLNKAASGETTRSEAFRAAEQALARSPRDYSFEESADLVRLRERMAQIRESARSLADNGTIETRVLQAQITALGPPPVDGAAEPSAITERRTQLDAQLARQMPPVLEARERGVRAALLVNELDELQKEIDRARLFQYSLSPLDPRTWVSAASGLSTRASQAAGGFAAAWSGPESGRVRTQALLAALLVIVGFVAGALIPHRVLPRIDAATAASSNAPKRLLLILLHDAVAAFLATLAIMALATAFVLLVEPILPQAIWLSLALTLLFAALIVMVAGWLGQSIFLSPFKELRIVQLKEEDASEARRLIRWIGAVVAGEAVLALAESQGWVHAAVSSLVSALLVFVGAWLVWKLIDVIRRRKTEPREQSTEVLAATTGAGQRETLDYIGPLTRILRVMLIAIVGAGLLGFVALSREILVSTVTSLAVIAIAIYLHRTIELILALLAQGKLYQYRAILHFVPMVTGLAIALAALPLLAIIWGYQSQEIADGFIALRSGVEFGEVKISAGDVMTFLLVFFAGYIATRWIQRILRIAVLPQFSIELGARSAIVTMAGYIGIVLAAAIAIATTGLDLSNLAFVAGALSVGLGFGLQSVVENFTSGIILLLERPVREGDWIEVGEYSGIVRKISVRSTRLETWDRTQIIIPNSALVTESVTNLSLDGTLARIHVVAGVAYGTDLETAKRILAEIAGAHELVLEEPAPFVTLDEFGDSSINLKLFCFVGDVTKGAGVRSDLNFAIARKFAEEGIEIPFPQRDLHVRSMPEGGIPLAGKSCELPT